MSWEVHLRAKPESGESLSAIDTNNIDQGDLTGAPRPTARVLPLHFFTTTLEKGLADFGTLDMDDDLIESSGIGVQT